MSKKGQRRFTTFESLLGVFKLRRNGWTYTAIGKKYGIDHSTVTYHCLRHRIYPGIPVKTLHRIYLKKSKPLPPPHKYGYIIFRSINYGKRTYKEYLEAAGIEYKPVRFTKILS